MKYINKIQYNSPVVLTYTLISLLVLLLGMATANGSTYLMFSVYDSSMASPFFYIRLFGHVLGHADFDHYFNNFLLILLVGPMLEEKYGSKQLLTMMFITAFITGIVHMVLYDTILLGASGIVFMMILLGSYANFQEGKVPMTLILVIVIFIGREVINGVIGSDNISQLSHIIGGIVGAVTGYIINMRKAARKKRRKE